MWISVFVRRLLKILKKCSFIFFDPVLLYGHSWENKGLKLVISLTLCFQNLFRNILYSEISTLTNFDVLIQSVFRVIQKIIFANLCMKYNEATIFQNEKSWRAFFLRAFFYEILKNSGHNFQIKYWIILEFANVSQHENDNWSLSNILPYSFAFFP